MEHLVHSLRGIADCMEDKKDAEVMFPGWPEDEKILSQHEKTPAVRERYASIRKAAKAIDANGISFDESKECTVQDLGRLVHYIADMMEV